MAPFCVKAMCFLQMSGARWKTAPGDLALAPKGKLPVLKDGDTTIPDSEEIRAYLEQKFGVDFDEGLTAVQRASSRAIIRMVDEHLYFVLVSARWQAEENWVHTRELLFRDVPEEMREAVASGARTLVCSNLEAQGMGRRHTEAERRLRADADISALATLLGEKPFLFGDKPTAADASAAPVLEALAKLPVETKLRQRITSDVSLMGYISRVEEALYI